MSVPFVLESGPKKRIVGIVKIEAAIDVGFLGLVSWSVKRERSRSIGGFGKWMEGKWPALPKSWFGIGS